MIARISTQAFFGHPPPGLRPRGTEKGTFPEPGSRVSTESGLPCLTSIEDYDGNEDLYSVSDGDGNYMHIDFPCRSSLSQSLSLVIKPGQQPAGGSSTNIQGLSGKPASEMTPSRPNSARSITTREIPETAQLQVRLFNMTLDFMLMDIKDEINALRKQSDEVKRQFKSSDKALEESNVKLESQQTAFELKDQVLGTKTKEYNCLKQNLNNASQQFQKSRGVSVALLAETQTLRKAQGFLNEQFREADTEGQNLRRENQALSETNDALLKQLQSMRDEPLADRIKIEEAQKVIERLLDRSVEDDQIHGIGQQSQGLHVACEYEINRLKQKVQQLRETRDSLKTLLNEAQKDAQEGHASTREVLRHMMSMRESEFQTPVTPRRPLFRDASRSWSWSGVKRENAHEAESGGTPTRGPKRVKQKEVVDLTD
jgi:hypothetical protein